MLAIVFILMIFAVGCSDSSAGKADAGNKGSVTITTEDGKTVMSSETEWPEGLPSEVPKPEGMKVTASTQSDKGNITVAIETEMPLDEAVKLYQDYIAGAGYKQTMEMKEDGYYTYSGTRGQEMFMFTFGLDQENGTTVTGAIVYENKG